MITKCLNNNFRTRLSRQKKIIFYIHISGTGVSCKLCVHRFYINFKSSTFLIIFKTLQHNFEQNCNNINFNEPQNVFFLLRTNMSL